MKLFRAIAALGAAAWVAKKVTDERDARRNVTRVSGASGAREHPISRVGTHASGAAAASGAFRDDRDISGVGVLRDEQATTSP